MKFKGFKETSKETDLKACTCVYIYISLLYIMIIQYMLKMELFYRSMFLFYSTKKN